MKALTLLVCLALLGCERRSADLELDEVRERFLSESGRKKVGQLMLDNRSMLGVSLEELVPRESWVIRRVAQGSEESEEPHFAIFAKEKNGAGGIGSIWEFIEDRFFCVSPLYRLTGSQMESLEDPVSGSFFAFTAGK